MSLYVPISINTANNNENNPTPYSTNVFHTICTENNLHIVQHDDEYKECPVAMQHDLRFQLSWEYRGAWVGNTEAIMKCIRYGTYVEIAMPLGGLPNMSEEFGIQPSIRTFVGDCGTVYNALVFTPTYSDMFESESESESAQDDNNNMYALTKHERECLNICSHESCGFVHCTVSKTSHNSWLLNPIVDKSINAYIVFAKTIMNSENTNQSKESFINLLNIAPCTRGSLIRCAVRIYFANKKEVWIPVEVEDIINRKEFRRGWKRNNFKELIISFL